MGPCDGQSLKYALERLVFGDSKQSQYGNTKQVEVLDSQLSKELDPSAFIQWDATRRSILT